MPIIINLKSAIYQWEHKHNERMTYTELAKRAEISLATLNRIKSGELIYPDLRKINKLCKVLECQPGDLLQRVPTNQQSLESVEFYHQERQQLGKDIEQAGISPDG